MKCVRYIVLIAATFCLSCVYNSLVAQTAEDKWVDSVYNSLSVEQRAAQLICMRANNPSKPYDENVEKYIKKYGIGGVCFFRGDAEAQLRQTNDWQKISKIPLMVSIDAEWGLGMRINGSLSYPYQMTLGALQDDELICLMGEQIAEQCKRMGIHVNFAPVVDVNSNPSNPVIGMRSFGENPRNVGEKGAAYALGMQRKGLITTMKHFPGHGNTSTDSHLTLPVVNAMLEDVENVEFPPFRYMIERGVNGAMVGHLYFPAIEPVENTSSSLSKNVVTDLLKDKFGFKGLIFTDGLDMKGVSQTISRDSVSYVAFMAGNDVLILPHDVPFAIKTIKEAANKNPQAALRLEESCKKILRYKYRLGLNKKYEPISTENLMADITKDEYKSLIQNLYDNSLTLLRNDDEVLPLVHGKKIAVVTIGNDDAGMTETLRANNLKATPMQMKPNEVKAKSVEMLKSLKSYDYVVVNVRNTSMFATKNYGIGDDVVAFINSLARQNKVVLNLFACPYALSRFDLGDNVKAVSVAYEDRNEAVVAVTKLMAGNLCPQGKLPVSVGQFKAGTGLAIAENTDVVNIGREYELRLDSVARSGIENKAYPGCQIMAMKDGKILYSKCFGKFTYDGTHKVQPDDIYDLASLTKVMASTLAVMKLYEDGLLDLEKTLGDYFPYTKKFDKGDIKLIEILTHQSGMKAWIPFYKETIDEKGPKSEYYVNHIDDLHRVRVADSLYIVNDYEKNIYNRIMNSKMGEKKYLYCDMGFYFVPKLVELLTNQTFENYLDTKFYTPMGLNNIGFCPLTWRTRESIAPTENDKTFRMCQVWGDVHDQAAAMMGGLAGHAGLFANAENLATIMQMLLDGGRYEDIQILKPETIEYFTTAHFTSNSNRRGIGFDKLPIDKKGPATASKSASMRSFGHTGFTGTFAWADPENKLLIIFLSNRVYPDAENTNLSKFNIRTSLHDILYEAVSEKAK